MRFEIMLAVMALGWFHLSVGVVLYRILELIVSRAHLDLGGIGW